MADRKSDPSKLAKIAFDDAMNKESIKDGAIEQLITIFENAANIDDEGIEYWYARDLQTLFAYDRWENFSKVIDKAKNAIESSGYKLEDHFRDVAKLVDIGSGAGREIQDIKLTRYACYLVAQNGDSRKKPVAFAQTYFAIQTRRQEIRDEDEASYIPMSEDQKRLWLREEIKEHNKRLASAAKNAGVVEPIDFAIFQNFGYKGLYGGLDRVGIQRAKKLKSRSNILDHMGSTELAANLFRATQAEDKLKRENIKGKNNVNNAHYIVGQKVRQAIKDIGGTMPESLPPAEDIAKVGRRLQKAIKESTKKDKKG